MKRSEIEQLLPQVFQRTALPGSPLSGLLDVMEDLHRRPEEALARLDETFDPRRTQDAFVSFLASWVDLDRLFEPRTTRSGEAQRSQVLPTGIGRLRELTANAAQLSRWRGTAHGLQRFLQIATGESAFRLVENQTADGKPRLYHLLVYAPENLQPHAALVDRIIVSEKPAHVTHELIFEPLRV